MKKNVSIVSEINDIIANGVVTIEAGNNFSSDFKESNVNGCKYEYYAEFEEELRKRARNMFKKKPVRFKVPYIQQILLVFSNHRGKMDEILKRLNKCSTYNYSPLLEIGLSKNEIDTLKCGNRELSYALSIMPEAYK